MGEVEIRNVHRGPLEKGILFLEQCCILVAFLSFVVMLVIIGAGTLARYLFNSPLSFVEEYSGYLLVVMGFLAMAPALRKEAHINVDIVMKLLPTKAKVRLDLVNSCFAIFIAAILFWVSLKLCWENYSIHVVSSTIMETPLWIPQLFIPLGWVTFILLVFLGIRKKMRAITGRRV
jgi:TRAP-type C4-dicarboxylate transport system permease small subunit